jgi:hypothetical protein
MKSIDDEARFRPQKDRKLAKHYEVLIGDRKAKIINHRFTKRTRDGRQIRLLELRSMIRFPAVGRGSISIEIRDQDDILRLEGRLDCARHSPGNYTLWFVVDDLPFTKST